MAIRFNPKIEEKLSGALEQKVKAKPKANPQMIKILTELEQRTDLLNYLSRIKENIIIYFGGTNEESIDLTSKGLMIYDLETSGRYRKIAIPECAAYLREKGYTPKIVAQKVEQKLEELL